MTIEYYFINQTEAKEREKILIYFGRKIDGFGHEINESDVDTRSAVLPRIKNMIEIELLELKNSLIRALKIEEKLIGASVDGHFIFSSEFRSAEDVKTYYHRQNGEQTVIDDCGDPVDWNEFSEKILRR